MSKKRKPMPSPSPEGCEFFVTTVAHVLLVLEQITPLEHTKILDVFCPCGCDHLASVPFVKSSIGESIAAIKKACAAKKLDPQALADELDYLQFKHMHLLEKGGL